jgi:hypothetical protein
MTVQAWALCTSQRFHASLAGSDTDRLFDLGHKNFAIADFSGFGLF